VTLDAAEFEHAAGAFVERLGPARLRLLADRLERDRAGEDAAVAAVPVAGFDDAARAVLEARLRDGVPHSVAVAYLRGVAAGYGRHAESLRVESVWSGPASHRVPVRATARVLVDLVAEASRELLLMTYSAKPYEPLLETLASALRRGVTVAVVVETLQGAGTALAGGEPAAAFASLLPAVELWHWPASLREETGAKMHAKLAVADRRLLWVSSANLTSSGVGTNIEAGLLVRGGSAPPRAAEHIDALKARGVLTRLWPSAAGAS
jgi:phosphatidylserine/phosphatidylglycerophosphate/cardiolipin synthase-like enzyme